MKWMLRIRAVTSALLAALVVMALSVVTLVIIQVQVAATRSRETCRSRIFSFMQGLGSRHQRVLEIDRYTDGRAVISSQYGMTDVGQYRYLAFDLSPVRLNEDLPLFFWRPAGSDQLHTMPLEENILDHLDLRRSQQWHGDISEFGFIFQTG